MDTTTTTTTTTPNPNPNPNPNAAPTTNATVSSAPDTGIEARYLTPDWAARHIVNPIVAGLVKVGFSVRGARELHVRGRSTGEWRTVPVNLLTHEGTTYLVAPRGRTQWVRNLRAAGEGRLRLGRRYDDFTAVELADADKAPILRAYLESWAFEVGRFFDGVDAESTDAQLAAIAPGFPVFEVEIA